MSRNASGQSNHYAETEPPLYQPSFSPHLGTITPTTPRDRLPDGCSLRKSPKFAHAFPIHREDIFEPIDPRYTTDQAITGMGTWADSTSPISPNQDLSMSRSSSGPGIAVEGANHGLGIAQFGGKLRFGQHEPFSVEEARQRTLEHERRLRAFDQGAFRPPQPLWGQGNWGGKNSGAGGGLGQPYPDINLIPTSSDEVVLQGYVDGRRRGLSAPGRPGIRGLGFEFDDEVYGQGV
ncbi:MAG: hypothetical protein M1830_006369 [Pleopsidium flavum]|nr:MAG: hypothetical protein M1830_006369 [Pleopsidium flavum]